LNLASSGGAPGAEDMTGISLFQVTASGARDDGMNATSGFPILVSDGCSFTGNGGNGAVITTTDTSEMGLGIMSASKKKPVSFSNNGNIGMMTNSAGYVIVSNVKADGNNGLNAVFNSAKDVVINSSTFDGSKTASGVMFNKTGAVDETTVNLMNVSASRNSQSGIEAGGFYRMGIMEGKLLNNGSYGLNCTLNGTDPANKVALISSQVKGNRGTVVAPNGTADINIPTGHLEVEGAPVY
jgi:hypothetical protein